MLGQIMNQWDENNAGTNNNPVTFDDFLKDRKNQAEFDKRVQKAINTAKANWEEIMNSEKTEAEKLAKMNKEQKLEYQAQKNRQRKSTCRIKCLQTKRASNKNRK